MNKNESGFSLFELMIVIAIIAILSAIAVPNFLSFRNNANLRGSAFNIKSDMELAKMRAIRSGANVVVSFSGSNCLIYQDNNANFTRDTTPSPGEPVVNSRDLDNITMTAAFDSQTSTAFNSRGQAVRSGYVQLSSGGRTVRLNVSRLGMITIQ